MPKPNSEITPATVQTVDFSEEIQSVKTQLTTRTAAQTRIKTTWQEVAKLLEKYGVEVPYRRVDIGDVRRYLSNIKVMQKPQELKLSALEKELAEMGLTGRQTNNFVNSEEMRVFEKHEPKAAKTLRSMANVYDNPTKQPRAEVNEGATEKARNEVSKAIDAYATAVIDFEENAESIKAVGEYVGIVEKVATVAATANGMNPKH